MLPLTSCIALCFCIAPCPLLYLLSARRDRAPCFVCYSWFRAPGFRFLVLHFGDIYSWATMSRMVCLVGEGVRENVVVLFPVSLHRISQPGESGCTPRAWSAPLLCPALAPWSSTIEFWANYVSDVFFPFIRPNYGAVHQFRTRLALFSAFVVFPA